MGTILLLLVACVASPPTTSDPSSAGDSGTTTAPRPLHHRGCAVLVRTATDSVLHDMPLEQPGVWAVAARYPGAATLELDADGLWIIGALQVHRVQAWSWSTPDLTWTHDLRCAPLAEACGDLLWMGCVEGTTLFGMAPQDGQEAARIDLGNIGTVGAPDRLFDLACADDALGVGLNPGEGDYQDPGRIVVVDPADGTLQAELAVDRNPRLEPDPNLPGRLWVSTDIPDDTTRLWAIDVAAPELGVPLLELSSSYAIFSVAVRPGGDLLLLTNIYGGRGMHITTGLHAFDPRTTTLTDLTYLNDRIPVSLTLDSADQAWALVSGGYTSELFDTAFVLGWDPAQAEAGLLGEVQLSGDGLQNGEGSIACW